MKNPLEFFPSYRKQKDKQRDDKRARRARIKIANNLLRLWDELAKFENNSYIDPATLKDLNITYEDLTLNEGDGLYKTTPNPNFFQPSTKEYFGGLRLDERDEETKLSLKRFHDDWIISNPGGVFETPPEGQTFCYWLRDWFECIAWKRPGDDESIHLNDLSEVQQKLRCYNWEYLLRHQDEPFYSAIYYRNSCNPFQAWYSDDKPHVVMTMENRLPSEDRVLVVEILAFVAVMWNRLVGGELYPEHNVVPMMTFTFSNDQRGRILQAYYGSKGLVIRKSKLYEFTTEKKCEKHMKLFLQYLTCSLEGPTRILDEIETFKAIKTAKASSAPVARKGPISSNASKPSNDAIAAKDFATSNAPSGPDILGPSNDTATSDSPVAVNASSDPDSDATNASNDLNASNVPAAGVASNQPIVSDASDGSHASHSRSSSSTHTFSSDDASKPTGSSGTPNTSFSSDLPDPQASFNLPEISIPSKRKRSTEELREVV